MLTTRRAKKTGNTSKKGDKDLSNKIQTLRNSKKSAKTRLTKAKKQLNDLLEKPLADVPLASKNAIRRGINKVNSEVGIIEKIIGNLKEIYAVNVDHEETEAAIEILDKELEDIGSSADGINVMAEQHLQERLDNGEAESVLTSHHSQKSHVQPLVVPGKTSDVGQKRRDAKAASERLVQLEDEQREKELELEKVTAELQLSKLGTD